MLLSKVKIWRNTAFRLVMLFSVASLSVSSPLKAQEYSQDIVMGAERFSEYMWKLEGRQVAVVANQSSRIGNVHLVDTLLSLKVNITKVFAPEHGFRGTADAGEHIKDARDVATGLPIISLYGKNKKPDVAMLKDVDVLLFDIQDVGARFYTYISTLHYIMEAAAEDEKEVIVLDRPNPNGHYIAGPILEKNYASFVGMHPVPIVHGMTIGEYAQMINGEKWLRDAIQCNLKVVTCENYSHDNFYMLPVKPSPNLPTMGSIYLYPTLCLFEGTKVSVGRGTDFPFQVIGYPGYSKQDFSFVPRSIPGASKYPRYETERCYGYDLQEFGKVHMREHKDIYLHWLVGMYNDAKEKKDFFISFFDKLAGTNKLRKQIEDGLTVEEILASWEEGLADYAKKRSKYLLYEDFN